MTPSSSNVRVSALEASARGDKFSSDEDRQKRWQRFKEGAGAERNNSKQQEIQPKFNNSRQQEIQPKFNNSKQQVIQPKSMFSIIGKKELILMTVCVASFIFAARSCQNLEICSIINAPSRNSCNSYIFKAISGIFATLVTSLALAYPMENAPYAIKA